MLRLANWSGNCVGVYLGNHFRCLPGDYQGVNNPSKIEKGSTETPDWIVKLLRVQVSSYYQNEARADQLCKFVSNLNCLEIKIIIIKPILTNYTQPEY